MTVKDVIIEAAYLVGEDGFAAALSGDGATADGENSVAEALDEEKYAAFLRCYNLALHETAIDYMPIRKTVNTVGGKVEFSSLGFSVLRVEGVYDKDGAELPYKVFPTHIVTPLTDVTIVFAVLPPDCAADDAFAYDKTRVSKNIFALGVASEFCFLSGRYTEADNFAKKFRAAVNVAPSSRGGRTKPAKRWGL